MANPYLQPNYQGNYFQPNYFPQPMQQPQMPMQNQQPPQDDRIWVASESAAEAFQMVPNGFVRLWDSNKPVFYEKRADMNGRPMPIVSYEYKIRDAATAPETINPDFEKRLAALEEKIKSMEGTKHDA